MDGFSLEGGGGACPGKAGKAPYQYVRPAQIRPYWDMAHQYVLADTCSERRAAAASRPIRT